MKDNDLSIIKIESYYCNILPIVDEDGHASVLAPNLKLLEVVRIVHLGSFVSPGGSND